MNYPKWDDHGYAAITFIDGKWFGYNTVEPEKEEPWYHEGWKGLSLTLSSSRGGFIKFGSFSGDPRDSYQIRPEGL